MTGPCGLCVAGNGALPAKGSFEQDAVTSLLALPMASAEYYVVHGKHDDPQAKHDALAGWVSEFESAHDGRSPSIYLGGMCSDLSPLELLAHMPAYLARSERLLVLAGPALPEQLWCAMECYAWVALGGCIENIEVVIVASTPASVRAVVSAFDAFHVMYSLSNDDTDTRRRLMAAIELAGIAHFNATLRQLMPRVQAAADRLTTLLSSSTSSVLLTGVQAALSPGSSVHSPGSSVHRPGGAFSHC
jgi:hypothetical protein